MIRTATAIALIALVSAAVMASTATAGKARNCEGSIKGHHVTCKVAERVVRKWTRNDFSSNNIRAGGTGWHCSFVEGSEYFNCFSNLSGRVSGRIRNQ